MSDTKTHRENILAALLCGERLSKLEMLKRFGCWNSGNVVLLLRRDGYAVKTDMVEEKGKRFARYFLEGNHGS